MASPVGYESYNLADLTGAKRLRWGGRVKVVFYPEFPDEESFSDHVHRAHWYLSPFGDQLELIAPCRFASGTLLPVPNYLDPGLAELVRRSPMHKQVQVKRPEDLTRLVETAEVVLLWRSDPINPGKVPIELNGRKVLRVDHDHEQYAGSHYLKFAEIYFPHAQEGYLERSKEIFARIHRRCASKIGYIFGTGPGLSHASDHDFSDGVSIACNSMVRNRDLLERLNPPLIAVADPIFHAGPSSYAAAFRIELIRALDRFNADLIVPMRDYHVYRTHLPERFADRIAAIPFRPQAQPNLDIGRDHFVATTSNVLTLFLIPLAATFFEDVRILGCDGRPLDQNSYFWSHDKASQFNDEMANIQKAHPAFFAIDYDDYYLTHCETLETWIAAAEAAGKSVTNWTPSYIPALARRSVPGVKAPTAERSPAVSVIMAAFNTEAYIEQAVLSVIAQDFTDWELLIIEDGSTDRTYELAEQLAAGDPRIRLMRNAKKGVSSARNLGMEQARGRYIAFLDSDDAMDAGSLGARVKALDEDADVKVVHSIVRRVDEKGRDLVRPYGPEADVTFRDMWRNPAHINTIMIRRGFAQGFRFREDMANGEDWLLFATMLRTGAVSRYVPGGTSIWRCRANSTTHAALARHERALLEVIDWVFGPCEENGVAPEYRWGLRSPDKAEVIRERTYYLLIWYLLRGDVEGVREILSDNVFTRWRLALLPAKRQAIVEAVAIRQFRRRLTELKDVEPQDKQRISIALAAAGIDRDDLALAMTIKRLFRLQEEAAPWSEPPGAGPDRAMLTDDDFALPRGIWRDNWPLRVSGWHMPAGPGRPATASLLLSDETMDGWQARAAELARSWFPAGTRERLRPALRLVETTTDQVHGIRRVLNIPSSGVVKFGGFARAAGRSVLGVWLGEEGRGVVFDLRTSAVACAQPSATYPILDAGMEKALGEWGDWRQFRFVAYIPEPGPLLLQFNIRKATGGGTRYEGDGCSGLDLWGVYALTQSSTGPQDRCMGQLGQAREKA